MQANQRTCNACKWAYVTKVVMDDVISSSRRVAAAAAGNDVPPKRDLSQRQISLQELEPVMWSVHRPVIGIGNGYWLVFRLIWYVVCSRYWMRLHGWSTVWDLRTTSPTLLPAFTWLRVPERIDYKVAAVLTYKVLHGSAPRYLGPLVPVADARPTDIKTLWWHQSSDGAICQTFNSWWPGVHGCWTPCLEHSAGGDNDVTDTLYLSSTT